MNNPAQPSPDSSPSLNIHDLRCRNEFADEFAKAHEGVTRHDVLEVLIQAAAHIYPSLDREELWNAVDGLIRKEEES